MEIAIASRAIEIRSPAVSSMSISRPGGSGRHLLGEVEQLVGGVAHRRDDHDDARCRRGAWSTIRSATRLIRSASATEEPPYFCTTSATAVLLSDWSATRPWSSLFLAALSTSATTGHS
ncbi:MAG: hypothetical protein WKF47_03065 [Geodermatophilaceae bacterium]